MIASIAFRPLALGILLLAAGGEDTLFDFEKDVAGWEAAPGGKEPPAVVERAGGGLKVTFAGGTWPTVASTRVPADWTAYKTLTAEVEAPRPCLIGLTAFQEKSRRGDGWDDVISRWTATVFLKAGRNSVRVSLEDASGNGYGLNKAKYGAVTALELFMYAPRPGESLLIDDIRVSAERTPKPAPARGFKVLGTDLEVSGVAELGKLRKDAWTPPADQDVDQAEAAFRAGYEALKKDHPGAVLAVLRDGEPGPDGKPYAGWADAHLESHGPDTNLVYRAKKYGGDATGEAFMRHRSMLLRADLSAIPAGSAILAARLLLTRASKVDGERNPAAAPTQWVAEACNRPWDEREVNGYQYAKDKFWRSVGGISATSYEGEDPDFFPLYLAHGPSQLKVNAWDFREAVRWWTDGRRANHGFMLHGDGRDYMMAHCRESADVRSRPALLVVYVPPK
ncbi:MAG TPA: DNRLRE domain-containing protein [Planctomycetota bacterium]